MGNSLSGVGADQGIIQELLFLMAHIRDQQGKKRVEALDFRGQKRFFHAGAVQQIIHRLVHATDFHDIDAVLGCWGYADELAADIRASAVKLVSFQGRNDKYLNSLAPHPQSHKLHRKSFAGAAGAKNGDICVLIDAGIKNIHNDQGVVMLVDSQQDATIIAHLVGSKWIAAGRTGGQDISF